MESTNYQAAALVTRVHAPAPHQIPTTMGQNKQSRWHTAEATAVATAPVAVVSPAATPTTAAVVDPRRSRPPPVLSALIVAAAASA
jgi:hypothetical protein